MGKILLKYLQTPFSQKICLAQDIFVKKSFRQKTFLGNQTDSTFPPCIISNSKFSIREHCAQAEAELISSYLNSHQAVEAAVAAVSNSAQAQQQQQTYGGVPIPPPLVPGQEQHLEDPHHPLPPQRSTSAAGGHSGGKEFHENHQLRAQLSKPDKSTFLKFKVTVYYCL